MATEDTSKVKSVALILAAGSSSRLGQSKQLLKIDNESLLRKSVRAALEAPIDQVVVMVGSNHKKFESEIADLPVKCVFNPLWQNGMGSTLKLGINFISENFPSASCVLIMVCDQPLITSSHLNNLIEQWRFSQKPIVASYYAASPGVPILFERSMFEKILKGGNEAGAKKIVLNNIDSVSFVEFPEGAIDIDTPEDLEKFLQRER